VHLRLQPEETSSGPAKGFKTCHGMTTKATYYPQTGRIFGVTHIWSHCGVGGLHGTAKVMVVDQFGVPLASVDAPDTWGVAGIAEHEVFGEPNDRPNLAWKTTVEIDPADLPAVDDIEIGHVHAPKNQIADIITKAKTIVSEGITHGRKASEIWRDITSLNQIFS
jgi:hypothetical protein